jgi:two-component system cell cycle sensor histidine kinase/response regulator CckA
MCPSGRRPIRVLILEDNESDAELVVRQLKKAGYDPSWHRVQNESEFIAALNPRLDVILADFSLPSFDAPRALELLKASGIGIPMIVVSGSIGEETAVDVLQRGAADYLLKDRLTRLGSAVQRVIDERRTADEKRKTEEALREAEDRTRLALNAARVGVWEADLRTGMVRWSEALETLHGMAPGTFSGTFDAFLDHIHPDDRAEVADSIDKATRDHTESHVLYRTLWPDDTTHWISGTGKTFYDDAGQPLRSAGIGLDVTERHALEEQYRQSQKVESIGQLAGGIAHDFNNLLTAIQGYCELLSEDLGPDSPHLADLGEIHRASDRAAALTRQLLAFSRRQILEPRVLDLRDSLRGLESMLRRLIGEHLNVVFRTTDESARVKADPGQIEQVILNLALNARDAMPQGGSLTIGVRRVELDGAYARQHANVRPGRHVVLRVTDTGMGMDAATQARIYEPFFTTKERGRGTGLGLSTVYGIVKQSGGHIEVDSEPGQGSTFDVYFPRVEEAVDDSPSPSVPEILTGSETILGVEDESAVRELVRRVLERSGYLVLAARTPQEALLLAQRYSEPIHVLLTDVVLPGMSGRTLAGQVIASRPATRVIYMSGYTDTAAVLLEEGALFLQKPFNAETLLQKVRAVLE